MDKDANLNMLNINKIFMIFWNGSDKIKINFIIKKTLINKEIIHIQVAVSYLSYWKFNEKENKIVFIIHFV